jgi:hypothetical protein
LSKGRGNDNVLFLIAQRTLESIAAKPVRPGQSEISALVCPVFAVAAVETFLYELGEDADTWASRSDGSEQVFLHGLATLLRALEKSRFQVLHKTAWVARYLTGHPPDLGSRIFQDFDILVRLRNTVIHLKDSEETLHYEDGSMDVEGTPKVINQLQERGLVSRPYLPSWLVAISTQQVAEWSCNTATRMIVALIGMLPTSGFKQSTELAHAGFVKRANQLGAVSRKEVD